MTNNALSSKENVLITGASSGIGYELAKVFAKHNYNLILTARNKAALTELQKEVKEKYNTESHLFIKDLSKSGAAAELYQEVKSYGLAINILVNNAGLGYVGEFLANTAEQDEAIMQLNMNALTELTKLTAHEMTARRSGKILNVGSTGSFHPGPYTSVYYASKAYVLSLSQALSIELQAYNIQVAVLCPGAVKTKYAERAGKTNTKNAMSPEFVAIEAYKELMKGTTTIIPGFQNRLLVKLPRKIAAPLIAKQQLKLKL